MSKLKTFITVTSGPVVIIKTMTPTQFDRGCEPLLKREGAYVYTKEETRVLSLNTGSFSVYSMNKTGGRMTIFLTRANAGSGFSMGAQHLLKSLL